MAAKKSTKKAASKKPAKKAASKKTPKSDGTIPLEVMEKRYKKLGGLLKRRGSKVA